MKRTNRKSYFTPLSFRIFPLALFLALGSGCGRDPDPQEPEDPVAEVRANGDHREKVSYAIGMSIGYSLRAEGFELDDQMLARGIADALHDQDPLFDDQELSEAMMAFQAEAQERMEVDPRAAENLQAGQAFLEENRQREGVQTTASGLQYEIVEEGDGPSPSGSDLVTVHYRGRLLDGTEFDSSYRRNEPTTFPVNGVISGWTEALQMMQVGSTWRLYIPPELGYGARGTGPIGPNSLLIFDVELLDIESDQ